MIMIALSCANKFDPDQAPQNVGLDLGSNSMFCSKILKLIKNKRVK